MGEEWNTYGEIFMRSAARKSMLKCYREPIMLYACKTWTINRQAEKQLMAVEIAGMAHDDDEC